MNKDHRPTNTYPADLLTFDWPITALASIAHRIAGIVLFVGIAFGLYALDISLASEAGFDRLKGLIQTPLGLFVTWGLLAALAYHFIAGIKHLLLDFGVAETLEGSIFAARVCFLTSGFVIFLAGVWVLQAVL